MLTGVGAAINAAQLKLVGSAGVVGLGGFGLSTLLDLQAADARAAIAAVLGNRDGREIVLETERLRDVGLVERNPDRDYTLRT